MAQRPPRRRARLDTVAKINEEIAKIYRRLADGKMTPAAAGRQVTTLVALRGGMADPVEQPKNDFTSPDINIVSCPHDHAFCPDGFLRPNFEAKALWDAHHAQLDTEPAPPLLQIEHAAPRSPEEEERIIDDLKNEIRELSEKLGIPVAI